MIGVCSFVEGDLFDISSRIREVDEGYFIVYSYRKRRFEVHHRGQRGGSLAFVVPFDRLDSRTVDYALRTRRERAAQFIAETEKENERKMKSERAAMLDKVMAAGSF